MKRFALLVLILVCLSVTAFAADVPAGDVFGGFSINHLSQTVGTTTASTTRYGWQASVAANVHPIVGIVADFGGQYKSVATVSTKNYQFLFGPRFNVRQDKVTYFAEALYGGNHTSAATASSNQFAMAYGGGVDVQAGSVSIRVIQFDWIPLHVSGTGGGWVSNNTRFGFGVVIPFGTK